MKSGISRALSAAALGLLLSACGSSAPLSTDPLSPDLPGEPSAPAGPLEPVIHCAPQAVAAGDTGRTVADSGCANTGARS